MSRISLIMANGPTILAVFKNELQFSTWEYLLKCKGLDVIPAMLSKEASDDDHPFVGDVLAKCREQGTRLDGVLLHDSSHPRDSGYMKLLHEKWEEADRKLASVDQDMEPYRMTIEATSDDPVQMSIRQAEAQHIIDEAHADAVERAREHLRQAKQAAEGLMLHNPPSEKGVELIRLLRDETSPYKEVPIVVGFAHPDKKEAFLQAGATKVKTTLDMEDEIGVEALLEAIREREAGTRTLIPKTPLDHASRQRPGRDQGFSGGMS
jgi:hypothetical protein